MFIPITKLNPVLFVCIITYIINTDNIVCRWTKRTMHNQQNSNLFLPLKVLNYIRIWLAPTKSKKFKILSILEPLSLSLIHMHF